IDPLDPADDISFVGIFLIVKPLRLSINDPQESLHGSPFLVDVFANAIVQAALQKFEEYQPGDREQQCEEDGVTEGEPEAEAACNPFGWRRFQLTPAVLRPAPPASRAPC